MGVHEHFKSEIQCYLKKNWLYEIDLFLFVIQMNWRNASSFCCSKSQSLLAIISQEEFKCVQTLQDGNYHPNYHHYFVFCLLRPWDWWATFLDERERAKLPELLYLVRLGREANARRKGPHVAAWRNQPQPRQEICTFVLFAHHYVDRVAEGGRQRWTFFHMWSIIAQVFGMKNI